MIGVVLCIDARERESGGTHFRNEMINGRVEVASVWRVCEKRIVELASYYARYGT